MANRFQFTRDQCEQLHRTPNVNPISGRHIKSSKTVLAMFKKCEELYNMRVPEKIYRDMRSEEDKRRRGEKIALWKQGFNDLRSRIVFASTYKELWCEAGCDMGEKITKKYAEELAKEYKEASPSSTKSHGQNKGKSRSSETGTLSDEKSKSKERGKGKGKGKGKSKGKDKGKEASKDSFSKSDGEGEGESPIVDSGDSEDVKSRKRKATRSNSDDRAGPSTRPARPQPAEKQRALSQSPDMATSGDSPEKRLQYCKNLSILAEKLHGKRDPEFFDDENFVFQALDMAQRYGYLKQDIDLNNPLKQKTAIKRAVQFICHPDKFPHQYKDVVTRYSAVLNDRIDRVGFQ